MGAHQPNIAQLSIASRSIATRHANQLLAGHRFRGFLGCDASVPKPRKRQWPYAARRREQAHAWMWERIQAGLRQAFDEHPQVAAQIGSVTQQVLDGQLPASTAARQLLGVFAKAS